MQPIETNIKTNENQQKLTGILAMQPIETSKLMSFCLRLYVDRYSGDAANWNIYGIACIYLGSVDRYSGDAANWNWFFSTIGPLHEGWPVFWRCSQLKPD